ncbi:MAG TPA: hypothetical protein V6C52_08190 [Coleofasciculaceae cyanobacterium]|jgi:hypothetical protein
MDNDAIRKAAKKVLADPDFQQYQDPNPFADLLKALRDMFKFELPEGLHGDPKIWELVGLGLKGLLIVLAVVAVGFVLKWLYGRYCQRRRPRIEEHMVTQAQRLEAQELYARLAAEALQSQDYRQAIHYLFLASVSQVIRDSAFNGAEFMTNREIAGASDFSRFGNPQQISGLFNTMIHFDEPRWFGNASISEQDFRQFDGFYSQFVASTKATGGQTHA